MNKMIIAHKNDSNSSSIASRALLLLLSFVTAFFFVFASASNVYAAHTTDNPLIATGDITVTSPNAIVIDAKSGNVLYAKDADEKINPASCTKILAAIVAIENCPNLQDEITVSENAVYGIDWSSSHIALDVDEVITVEEALYGMLLASANDCAVAVAEYTAGSVEAFNDMMNAKAEELGCLDTHFTNPHGLYDEDHYTTVHDLAIIMQYCVENETFVEIASTPVYEMPATNKNESRELWNSHRLIEGKYYSYEPFICGKNGYINESNFNLVSYASKDNMDLIVVVADNPIATDTAVDTIQLFDYFFDNYISTELSFESTGITSVTVGKKEIQIKANGTFEVFLPRDYNIDNIEYNVVLKDDVKAPIEIDDCLGRVDAVYNGEVIGTTKIYSAEQVKSAGQKIGKFFKVLLTIIIILFLLLVALILYLRFTNKGRRNGARYRKKNMVSGNRSKRMYKSLNKRPKKRKSVMLSKANRRGSRRR